MLIQFSFENYRSFKDPATLSMLASSGKENPDNVFETSAGKLLKSVAVFGSNASGKSNLIKALAAAIQPTCNTFGQCFRYLCCPEAPLSAIVTLQSWVPM